MLLHSHLLELIDLTWWRIKGGGFGAVEAIWLDAVQFQSHTGRTGPGVGCRGIALDLPATAALASSHD